MRINETKKLNNAIFITKDTLRDLSSDKEETITKNILRWSEKGKLISLKNGIYILKETYDSYSKDANFLNLIANKLRTPSYVSLEYVLSKYNILTEATYPITSVTLKTGRTFENKLGTFIYKSIKKELFTGYTIEKFLNNDYYIATKTKALFDYIYFKANTLPIDIQNFNLVEELRLNLNDFSKKDFKELERYGRISRDRKIVNIVENIIKHASNNI